MLLYPSEQEQITPVKAKRTTNTVTYLPGLHYRGPDSR